MRFAALFLVLLLPGCILGTADADLLAEQPNALKDRQVQTRYFDTVNEKKLLQASAAVLQDLGFVITKSETKVGLIAADKDRSALETSDVALNVMMFSLALMGGGNYQVKYDDKQKIMLSLVVFPVKDSKRLGVRVNVARIVWDNMGAVVKQEAVKDEKIFQEFFEKLEQSVFLTAHEI